VKKLTVSPKVLPRKCSSCGSEEVVVLIKGEPYCRKCAERLIRQRVVGLLLELKRRGVIPETVEVPEQ